MIRARFTGSNHYHDGERLERGDVVELTEDQYQLWHYQFVRLDEDSDGGESSESTETDSESEESDSDDEADESSSEDEESAEETESDSEKEEIAELLEGTVDEVGSEISSGDYDDRLDEIEVEEMRGEERKMVIDAVEDRREKV